MSVFAAAGLAIGLLAAGGASGSSTPSAAEKLMALNPAALLGGRTIVGTTNGQRLTAGSGNDTIAAYGPDETIVGGAGVDQMGAFATNVTIDGGTGSDVIYAGPKATVVSGGPAPDLVVDTNNDGTVRLTGNHDEVMLTGHNDRVLCAPSSHDSIIYSKQSVSVDSTCRKNGARLYDFDQSPPKAGFRLVDATTLQGSGTNDDPYVKPCDNPSLEDCTVTFDDRWMPGGWGAGSVETVPAYRCPKDQPYLYAKKYVPWGTSVIDGVEIVQTSNPWAINVYIGDASSEHPNNASKGFATGTLSGPFSSGATNWTAFRNAYRVVLHCTSNSSHGWG